MDRGGGRFQLQMLGGLTLLRPDGSEDPALGARGRKLVLLGYLALARRPVARDQLATFLWGHRDDERARHSLRDALSVLRQALGSAIPTRRELIALEPDAALEVDVLELRAAARLGDHARVVALYRGAFLDGVHVSDAHEVADWIAEERRAAERLFVTACAAECARLAQAGEWDACALLARRWLDADALDAAPLEWRMRALAAPDTPAALRGALAEYQRHAGLLAKLYEETPAASARVASEQLAIRLAEAPDPIAAVAQSPKPAEGRAAPPVQAGRRPVRWSRRTGMAVAAGAILLLTAAAVALLRPGATPPGATDLVVAGIESPSRAPEDNWLEDGLPRLLASSLLREQVPGVVDPSRVRAAARTARLGNPAGRTTGAEALLVARRLGAATLVSGEITRGGGRYLLDLAVRDVTSGAIRQRVAVSDTGLFALVDQATARLLAAVDRPGSGFRFADVETSSVEAYRAYTLALDRLDAGRNLEAEQLLDAAVAADSSFAAALQVRMQLLTSLTGPGRDSLRRLSEVLPRVRRHQTDFDRRAAEAMTASAQGDAGRGEQIARDLVTRYPRDPRAYALLIHQVSARGNFAEAVQVATRALALDSAGRTPGSGPCATCGLYGSIVMASLAAGDAARAYSAAQRAASLNPAAPAPWLWLSRALLAKGLAAEAIAAAEKAWRLAPLEESTLDGLGWLLLETGQLAAADSLIRDWGRPGSELTGMALDLQGALWRERGQYEAAARVNARAVAQASGAGDTAALRLIYASSLARTGDVAAARRVFELAAVHTTDTAGRSRLGLSPSTEARTFVWPHALLADAVFLSGSRDTLLLLALADSIEIIGRRSGFGRDGRLHFHVRGLIAEAGGRWADAERAFEQARWGRGGWTRTNVELARTQLAQGRARDAIATLQDARFGTLGGMGRYAPHSEINAALAEAFLAARLPDSARVYAALVRAAWPQADPPQRRRLAAIERAVQGGTVAEDIHRRPRVQPHLATAGSLRGSPP
jgi:DNA-binding SARP family transcriptional activator/Flp pilus assembly protein TadD